MNRIFRIVTTSVLGLVFRHRRKTWFARFVLVTAACVQLMFSPSASALILNPAFGFGAGTEIQGSISQNGFPIVGYGSPGVHRDTGGNGVLSAFDSRSISNGAGSQTTTARADAALGTLGGFVSGSGFVPPGSGGGSFGRAFAEVYNEYTLSGPSGLTPTILLNWTFDGSFSQQTPGTNNGIATFSILLRGAGPIIGGVPLDGGPANGRLVLDQSVSSNVIITTNDSGIVDVSQAFFNSVHTPLTVGGSFNSFIIDADLTVDGAVSSDSLGGSLTADFLHSGRFSLSSTDFGVTISPATPQSPVPEPSTLLLLGFSLVGMGGFAWHRLRRLSAPQ